MATDEIPESWLVEFNARMSDQEVSHIQRPFLALLEWTKTHQCTILGESPVEKKVFDWFYARSPAGAHLVPDMYQGVFYFDAAFWPVRVPQMYRSNPNVNIAEFLLMPEEVKNNLFQQPEAPAQYKAVWADCFDYSYGIDDNRFETNSAVNAPFFASANQQLSASASLLLQRPIQPKSMESCRMAVEMFLKAYLCIHHSFTEGAARRYSHDLERSLTAILSLAPTSELQRLSGHLGVFPEVGERYVGKNYTKEELWQAYRSALYAGACVARSVSTRNMRAQLGIVF